MERHKLPSLIALIAHLSIGPLPSNSKFHHWQRMFKSHVISVGKSRRGGYLGTSARTLILTNMYTSNYTCGDI